MKSHTKIILSSTLLVTILSGMLSTAHAQPEPGWVQHARGCTHLVVGGGTAEILTIPENLRSTLGGMISARASIAIQVFDLSSGRQVKSFNSSQKGVHLGEESAINLAMKRLGEQAGEKVVEYLGALALEIGPVGASFRVLRQSEDYPVADLEAAFSSSLLDAGYPVKILEPSAAALNGEAIVAMILGSGGKGGGGSDCPSEHPISDVDRDIPKLGMSNPDAWAVVIGNRRYEHDDVVEICVADHDAEIMKEHFVNLLGIPEASVFVLEDATLAKMYEYFGKPGQGRDGKLGKLVDSGESDVYVYYSGHGVPYPKKEGAKPYLLTADSHPDFVKQSGYRLQDLYKNLRQLNARSLTVIVDACFSGGSGAGSVLEKDTDKAIRFRVSEEWLTAPNAVCFASCSEGETSSWLSEEGHSLYTYYFLKGLRGEADADNDGKITFAEIDRYVCRQVPRAAIVSCNREQNPKTKGNLDRVLVTLRN